MTNRRRILILSYSNLSTDPRVIRQINSLKNDHDILAYGLSPSNISGISFLHIRPRNGRTVTFHHEYPVPVRKAFSFIIKNVNRIERRLGKLKRDINSRSNDFEKRYWSDERKLLVKKLSAEKFDLIIANEIDTLPLALLISGGKSRIILDTHEYYPGQYEHDEVWMKYNGRYVHYLCEKYMNKADAVFAVSEGIISEFEKTFGVKPLLLTNAAPYAELTPSGVDENKIKIIHHGASIRARKLELMIELMNYTDDRFTLDLMLIPTDKAYHSELSKLAAGNSKVRLADPVSTETIPHTINSYDIGLFILPPVNFNYRHALPNKFFEFVQARLAVAIGPSVEMEKYVRKYDLGIVARDFSPKSMAEELNKLDAGKISGFKRKSHMHALELSAEKNTELIRSIANHLLN
ncbi:MAG: glycosyltransferase [Ignavibacteria bacterium]|nr:glycosyltransferase [Ignavibacteria bacterium]